MFVLFCVLQPGVCFVFVVAAGCLPATSRLNMFWPLDDSACSSAAEVQAAAQQIVTIVPKRYNISLREVKRDAPSMLISAPAMKLPFLDDTSTAARTLLSLSTAFIAASRSSFISLDRVFT